MTCAFGRNSLISKWDAAEARPSIEQIRDGGFCVNSALFSPIFSRAREKIGPSETTCSCKSARINPSGASRQLPLHKGALVRAQVESLPFQGRWLGEAVVELVRPIREKTEQLLADKAYLESIYKEGAERASYLANKTLRKVYKKVGFVAR